jgi:hypothetical protein
LALDSGVKKKPSVERGPKAISVIRQPMPITSAGVRQVPATAPGMTPDPEGVSRFSLVVMAAPVQFAKFKKPRNIERQG